MKDRLIYPVGTTAAVDYACKYLKQHGIKLVDHPTPDATHLLLDIPSFAPDGALRSGGTIERILERLPQNITVAGGNLNHPALAGYQKIDLLQDQQYLARNAAITADCALQVAAAKMTTAFFDSPAVIIGWGRIGKCLGQMLRQLDAGVTIAARKESDRAMLQALGYEAVDMTILTELLPHCRLIFNTAPELVLTKKQLSVCQDCVKIDLASKHGLEGDDVVWARGLPGVYAPESSGRLIARSLIRLIEEASE